MSENAIQPKEGKDVKWNTIKQIGVAAKDAAKRLFLRSQDVLSEERMGQKAEEKKPSKLAKLVLAGALAAGCTYNYDISNNYGEDGGQDQDTAGDVDTDSDADMDTDADTDTDTDADTDSDGDTDTGTESDTGTETETDTGSESETEEDTEVDAGDTDTISDTETATETDTADAGCVEEVLDVGGEGFVTSISVFDENVGVEYTLSIFTDSTETGEAYLSIPTDGYPTGPFTIEHRFFGEGVPEYTNSLEAPGDRSDRHNISMMFNNEFWELAQFDGAMQTVKLGKQAVFGIINAGESITLPNGYKLRLDDISSVVDESGERDAIMTLLNASDEIVGAMALTPGRIVNVMDGFPPLFVKVNETASGYSFGAKWAEVIAYADVLILQNGGELPGGEKVELTLSLNSAEITTLKAIRVSRPVNECD